MRRRDDNANVAFIARIDPNHKKLIDAALPMHGGKTWATELAVRKLCDLTEGSPLLQARVHDLIEKMKETEPPRGPDDFEPRITRETYDRFNLLFPQKGATTWFLRAWVPLLVDHMEEQPPLEEIIERSVKSVLQIAPTTV